MRAVVHGVACRRTGDVKFTGGVPACCELNGSASDAGLEEGSPRIEAAPPAVPAPLVVTINALAKIREDGTASDLKALVTGTQAQCAPAVHWRTCARKG